MENNLKIDSTSNIADISESVKQAIIKDSKKLLLKMDKAIEEDNIGTFKNLISALGSCQSVLRRDIDNYYKDEIIKLKTAEKVNCSCVKNNLFYDEWEDRFLKKYDAKKEWQYFHRAIFYTTNDMRNIGKTTFLINMARKHDGVYVGSNVMCNEAAKQGIKTAHNIHEIRGLNLPVFIDEGIVSKENIELLDRFKEYFAFVLVK